MKKLIARFIREDSGQDLIEYALLAGIIVTLSAVAITTLGDRVKELFDDLNTAIEK